MQFVNTRSNRSIFIPDNSASPRDGLFHHVSCLGQLARLDFEHFNVAGEVIFKVDGDASPVSQQDEESRIGTLAYAFKKLGNQIDAAEFIRCLNSICEGGDARYRQATASHYYREIVERGVGLVLKEMALLAMQLEQLNNQDVVVVEEEVLTFNYSADDCSSNAILAERAAQRKERRRSLFDQEVEAITHLTKGRRKAATFAHDDLADWVNDLEASDASIEELDAAFETLEAMDQYDESGAIIVMSSHERTTACGKVDPEFAEEDIPERARYLASELRRAYANGVSIEAIWEDINAQLDVIFPISGKTATGGRFYSHANREWQKLAREILETILAECQTDFHLIALRTSKSYRQFHKAVRAATDTRKIGEIMKQAYEARQTGGLPLKHFTTLNTAAQLQRLRLKSARLSQTAADLLKEIATASDGKLRFLRWAMYGNNQPQHPVHKLSAQEVERVWEAIKSKPARSFAMAA
jgi:hypothetical protein